MWSATTPLAEYQI